MRKLWWLTTVVGSLTVGAVYLASPRAPEAQTLGAGSSLRVETGSIAPDTYPRAASEAVELSPAARDDLRRRKMERREQFAALVDNTPWSPAGLLPAPGRESVLDTTEALHGGAPSTFLIGRNNLNTNANIASANALGATVAEPAAVNNGARVFAAGNFNHAEHSEDGGLTWTDVPLPGGPSDAPFLCCDHDVVFDDVRRVVFHSALYTNLETTNGVVRIFVRRPIPTAACSFTIDPGGTADNVVADYPHIGLTKRFLYLTINAVPTSGTSSGFARIYRFNLDEIANCVTASFTAFTQSFSTFGQRVWVPVGGTNNFEAMYWGQHDNSTTFRIFRWNEASAAPESFVRTLTASEFTNPDCRGGTGNFDWIENSTAFSIAGFRHRGAAAPEASGERRGILAFYWNAGPDSVHPQGHVHAAVFNLATLALVAEPHIFSNSFCFGFPVVTANKRGDLGISIAAGGRAGGGGTAAQGFVGIADDFTSGPGSFDTFFLTASGTRNRSDGRYGDYFTIHPHEPCEKWFSATNYALLEPTVVNNINSRYIEFGRQQSFNCYDKARNLLPEP